MHYRLQIIFAALFVGCSYAADKSHIPKNEHKESDKVLRKHYQFKAEDEDGLAQFFFGSGSVAKITDLVVDYVEPEFFYEYVGGDNNWVGPAGEILSLWSPQRGRIDRWKGITCYSVKDAQKQKDKVSSALVVFDDDLDGIAIVDRRDSLGGTIQFWRKERCKVSLWQSVLMGHRKREKEAMCAMLYPILCVSNKTEQDQQNLKRLEDEHPALYKECCKRYNAMNSWGADS